MKPKIITLLLFLLITSGCSKSIFNGLTAPEIYKLGYYDGILEKGPGIYNLGYYEGAITGMVSIIYSKFDGYVFQEFKRDSIFFEQKEILYFLDKPF